MWTYERIFEKTFIINVHTPSGFRRETRCNTEATWDVSEPKKFESDTGSFRSPKYSKAAFHYCTPEVARGCATLRNLQGVHKPKNIRMNIHRYV